MTNITHTDRSSHKHNHIWQSITMRKNQEINAMNESKLVTELVFQQTPCPDSMCNKHRHFMNITCDKQVSTDAMCDNT